MKKVLITVALMLALSGISDAIYYGGFFSGTTTTEFSKRLMGINPMLIGILSDEYSDYMAINTANILDIEGYRVYPQLSNIGLTGNEMLLGGIAPAGFGNIGAFVSFNIDRSPGLIEFTTLNSADIDSSLKNAATLVSTIDLIHYPWWGLYGEHLYEEKDTAAGTLTREEADSSTTQNTVSLTTLAGLRTFDFADVGVRLGYYTQSVAAIRDYAYLYENDADANDFRKHTSSGEDRISSSVISVAPSVRGLSLMGVDLGGSVQVALHKRKTISADDTALDFGQNYTAAGWPAFTDTYSRRYSLDEDLTMTGAEFGLILDGSYPLSESVNLKGFAAGGMLRLSGETSTVFSDKITEDGGLAIVAADVSGRETTDNTERQDIMAVLAGVEKKMPGNLLLGAGIGYGRAYYEKGSDLARAAYVQDGANKFATSAIKSTYKWNYSTVVLPLGLEWRPAGWLSVRTGASYIIAFEKISDITTTTTYADDTEGAAVSSVVRELDDNDRSVDDSVEYYAGFGFVLTEHLTVDTVARLVGTQIDMSRLDLSATLKF